MAHKFAELTFTPGVRALQSAAGSRSNYAAFDEGPDHHDTLGDRETQFIQARDSVYLSSVGETGWPYIQHRGGPRGFMKVLNNNTLGFADFSGNRQYISTANVQSDNRVALFFMDYPNRTRLKLLGRMRSIDATDTERLAQLLDDDYAAHVERGFTITVEAFDWNCPAHITPRFSQAEIDKMMAPHNNTSAVPFAAADRTSSQVLGTGPLALVVSGMRQLTPEIRAFELRDPAGGQLPAATPGAHLRIPVTLADGDVVERHYSITSPSNRREAYEIAVQRSGHGNSGSAVIHEQFRLGTTLALDPPDNHFALHKDARPAILIAGGIGITPIKAMAHALQTRGVQFVLHYAASSHINMAYRHELEHHFPHQLHTYSKAAGQQLDLTTVLRNTADDALIYVCGPERMTVGVLQTAARLGIPRERVQLELFN